MVKVRGKRRSLGAEIMACEGRQIVQRYQPGTAVRWERGYRFVPVGGFVPDEKTARMIALGSVPDRALARVRVYVWSRDLDGDLRCDTYLFSATIRTDDAGSLVPNWDFLGV